ncbi:MAG: DMT family transporter [Rikenellaceae bacterium]
MRNFVERVSQHHILYHILAIAVVSVWGVTFVSSKILLMSGITPADIIFYRFLLAYVGICIISRPLKLFADTKRDELLCLLMGLFGGTLYFITENIALKFTNVSNVALICGTTPLMTMLIQYYVIKRTRPKNRMLVGSVVTLLGVAAVIFNSNFILKINPIGDFLCLLSALSWTFYTLLSKHLSGRYSALFLVRKTFIYGIITLAPTFIFSPLTTSAEVMAQSVVWGHLLFLGGVGSFLCFIIWNKCMRKVDTVILSNYIYLMPVVSIIASTIILGESLNIIIITGAVLVIAGLYMAGKR